jgi:creatinine deaminase
MAPQLAQMMSECTTFRSQRYWLPSRIIPLMPNALDPHVMLSIALAEARKGLAEGGIPIGAAIFDDRGTLLGSGRNRRVQNNDPSLHAETDAFRNAGRQRSYRKLTMVSTLAPCWYCSGLIRQFGFPRVIIGESRTFQGGIVWLRSIGIEVVDLDSDECLLLLSSYIQKNPDIWREDIGQED